LEGSAASASHGRTRHDRSDYITLKSSSDLDLPPFGNRNTRGVVDIEAISQPKKPLSHRRKMPRNGRIVLSEHRLLLRDRFVSGCSIGGCPLASWNIFKLIHSDHREDEEKIDCVMSLKPGPEMEAEYLKTDAKCLYHHWVHTREMKCDSRRCYRRSDEIPPNTHLHRLAQYKERVQCEHPLHSSMPYASMILPPDQDPWVHSFFAVSHIGRVGKRSKDVQERARMYLAELQSVPPAAKVHCSFCHALITVCEEATLQGIQTFGEPSPYIVEQFRRLEMQFPAFVALFILDTWDVDWSGIYNRQFQNASLGQLKKKRKQDVGSAADSADDFDDGSGSDSEQEQKRSKISK
jgi:hypothetical protein